MCADPIGYRNLEDPAALRAQAYYWLDRKEMLLESTILCNYTWVNFMLVGKHVKITFRARLHQASESMLRQLCNDASYTVLIEKNGVVWKWVAIRFWSDSIVFNENSVTSVIAIVIVMIFKPNLLTLLPVLLMQQSLLDVTGWSFKLNPWRMSENCAMVDRA